MINLTVFHRGVPLYSLVGNQILLILRLDIEKDVFLHSKCMRPTYIIIKYLVYLKDTFFIIKAKEFLNSGCWFLTPQH